MPAGLSPSKGHHMVLPTLPDVDRIKQRIQAPDYRDWRKKVEDVYGCLHPVRLSGSWQITDKTTGHVLTRPDGRPAETSGHILSPCGNRRESVCPACSDRYAADAFQLMRAGLSGGSKGVPVTVSDKPRLFVTLTAPSFGPVHNRRTTATGKHAPCRCGRYHHEHDPLIGQAIDPDGYDYTGPSCGRPTAASSGTASRPSCGGTSPARPGSPSATSPTTPGCPTPRSPSSSGEASSTSTP